MILRVIGADHHVADGSDADALRGPVGFRCWYWLGGLDCCRSVGDGYRRWLRVGLLLRLAGAAGEQGGGDKENANMPASH